MWIPVQPQHPVLAQIFVDWRLSDDAQFPDLEAWGITEGAWAELHEGFLGPSYEDLVPEWFADDYFTYYPTIEQLEHHLQADRLGLLRRQLVGVVRLLAPRGSGCSRHRAGVSVGPARAPGGPALRVA